MNDPDISIVLFRNIVIAISILLIFAYAILGVKFPRIFAVAYNFSGFFKFKMKNKLGSEIKLSGTESFYTTAMFSASFSFVVFNILLSTPVWINQLNRWVPHNFWIGILLWLLITMIVMLICLLRYLFFTTVGWLFNLPLSASRHYQEAQSLNNCFVMSMGTLSIIFLYSHYLFPTLVIRLIVFAALIYLIYRIMNVYVKLNQLGSYSKLYIFSYFCTTEIIPAIIGLKLLVLS